LNNPARKGGAGFAKAKKWQGGGDPAALCCSEAAILAGEKATLMSVFR
jgi:hypothetical protein